MEKIALFGDPNQVHEMLQRLKYNENEVVCVDVVNDNLSNEIYSKCYLCIVADDVTEQMLVEKGVDIKQIVNYSRFKKTTYDDPLFEYRSSKKIYTGLILGMSHSQCAIDSAKLTNNTYCKLSAPSLDMFLHLRFMEKIVQESPEKLQAVRHVIIELPYYIFNYDLSKFGEFAYTKLKYFDIVHDYHYFGRSGEQQQHINEYKNFVNLFKAPTESHDEKITRRLFYRAARQMVRYFRIATNNDKVWRVLYESTIKENQMYWLKLQKLLSQACPNATVTVLIMPFNPIFRLFHIAQIKKMKRVFQKCIGKGAFKIIDHFACLKNVRYFDDHCHLNKRGSEKYMKVLIKSVAKHN